MIQIRKNRQEHLTSPLGAAGLLRISLLCADTKMFDCIYVVPQVKEAAS